MSDKYEGHTPGPWRAEICDTDDGPRWKVLTDTPNFKAMALARVMGIPNRDSWGSCKSCKANAHLMAAAPDLLAENARLRRLVSLMLAQAHEPSSSRGDEIALELDALGFGGAR